MKVGGQRKPPMQRMIREIELSSGVLVRVCEDSSLPDDAGVVVWDAALVLCHYLGLLSHQGAFFKGQRVIDVGCGTGVVGLCAAALGARAVALTDLPHLVPLAERNIELNGLAGVASASALRWGEPVGHLQPPFDVILASDVIYQAAAVPALLATLRELSGPGTVIIIAAEHRAKLPFPCSQFAAAGFAVSEVCRTELHPEWSSDDIFVYRLSLQPAP